MATGSDSDDVGQQDLDDDQSCPFQYPITACSGSMKMIINSLTPKELVELIGYYEWHQVNGAFDDTQLYKSRSYYRYRTNRWIDQAEKALDAKAEIDPKSAP